MSLGGRALGAAAKVKPRFPEKWKGGRVEKMANYFRNILDDYKSVAMDTWQDMKDRPLKSSVYISILTGLGVLMKTRPSESDFDALLTEDVSDLMLLSELTRNPKSMKEIQTLAKAHTDGKLVHWNLGVVGLMCKAEFDPKLGLYEARCKYLKPHWTQFHKTIVDVGIFGKWRRLEEAMIEYDVHPDEWQDDGFPNKDFVYYKDKTLVSWDMKITR